MTTAILRPSEKPAAKSCVRPLHRVWRRLALRRLGHLKRGRLVISDALGLHELGSLHTAGMHAELVVHDPRFYGCLVFGGILGAVEAYRRGYWESPNLTNLVRLFSRARLAEEEIHILRGILTAVRRRRPGGKVD